MPSHEPVVAVAANCARQPLLHVLGIPATAPRADDKTADVKPLMRLRVWSRARSVVSNTAVLAKHVVATRSLANVGHVQSCDHAHQLLPQVQHSAHASQIKSCSKATWHAAGLKAASSSAAKWRSAARVDPTGGGVSVDHAHATAASRAAGMRPPAAKASQCALSAFIRHPGDRPALCHIPSQAAFWHATVVATRGTAQRTS